MDDHIFVDTSMFKALVDPKDDFHKNALAIWSRLAEKENILVTSNYILDEAYTLIRSRCGREVVEKFRENLFESTPVLKIIRITVADETAAWEWFGKDWSKLSFTDCVSFALMQRLSLVRVATFDNDFRRAGFQIEK